jgi:hypothetical protein
MEKRINSKVTEYIDNLKQNIKTYVEGNTNMCFKEKSDLLKFIYA